MKWTVKLVVETAPGNVTEHEVAQIDREETTTVASLGLSIAEGKSLLATVQTLLVTAQVKQHRARLRCCHQCHQRLSIKGYYRSTFRSVFGNVPMRIQRLVTCACQGARRSFSTLVTGKYPTSPELSYLNAKLAALLPFGKVADFLGEVLPVSAKTNASTVRNRAMRIGKQLERDRDQLRAAVPASRPKAILLGLDGGYVKNRHRSPERNFEIIAGKVLGEPERPQRFAFVRGASSFGVGVRGAAEQRTGLSLENGLPRTENQ